MAVSFVLPHTAKGLWEFKCKWMLSSFHFPERNLKQVASRCIPNGMLIDSVQKEIKDVNTGKEKIEVSLFIDDILVRIENLKESMDKFI